jgi:hypothetical protein
MTDSKEMILQSFMTDNVEDMPTILQVANILGIPRQMVSYYKRISGIPYSICRSGSKRISPDLLVFSYDKAMISGNLFKGTDRHTRLKTQLGFIKGNEDLFYDIISRIGGRINDLISLPVSGKIYQCKVIGGLPGKSAFVRYNDGTFDRYADIRLSDISESDLPLVEDLININRICDNG